VRALATLAVAVVAATALVPARRYDDVHLNSGAKEVLKKFFIAVKKRRGLFSKLEIVLGSGTTPKTPPGNESLPLALVTPTPNGRRP